MSVVVSPSDSDALDVLTGLRADGGVRLAFHADGARTRLAELEERGGFRAKFPRGDTGAEAVLINTGGGMFGGDRYRFDVAVGPGAYATVASQAAERIYRSLRGSTNVRATLHVGPGASLAWLPQETILFNGARLDRRIEADVAEGGILLVAESTIFGRGAMGETVVNGSFADHWSIRRDSKLVFAEAVRMSGDLHAQMQIPALGAGARAAATLLYVAPDAEDMRDSVRAALGEPFTRAAVSAWNGMLTARFLAADPAALRRNLVRVAILVLRRAMPRVWNC